MTSYLAAMTLALAIVIAGRPSPFARLTAWRSGGGSGRSPTLVPSRWVRVATVSAGVVAIGVVLVALRVPIVAGLAIGATAVVAQRLRISRQRAREREARSVAAVEVTFALAGELRAGRTPAQALLAVAPIAGPLADVLHAAAAATAMGAAAGPELARAADLPGAEHLRYVAAAWSVAETAGGRIAVVLERLSETMDSDAELRRELDAAMAGPRATMTLLATLPLLGLGLGQSVGADPLALLLHRPLGWALLLAAAILDGIGVVVTRAILRLALRA
jgi:tight adherence protein B